MTAEQFLLCQRRFIATRGKPKQIISDYTSQFKVAKSTVEDAWEKYGESSLQGEPIELSIPKDRIQNRIDADLATPWIQEFFNALSDVSIFVQ